MARNTDASDYGQRQLRSRESVAISRGERAGHSPTYRHVLKQLLGLVVPAGCSVLHVGCADGEVLASLKPTRAVGVEPAGALAAEARRRHPGIDVLEQPLDGFEATGPFDFIVAADVLSDCFDVDDFLDCVRKSSQPSTRVVISSYSQLWRPILAMARSLRLARPRFGNTWFSPSDLREALHRCGFEVIADSPEVLIPLRIPVVAAVANRVLARLPLVRHLCMYRTVVARPVGGEPSNALSVSVVVPARNEEGNVPRLMSEIPSMGSWTEVIFVEGNSTDGTWDALEAAIRQRNDPRIRLVKQPGRGKGDAVRAGFAEARGDILMILDADLTVPAETLSKFYLAIASGHAEFANGSRLVYPMDRRAMQFLNLLANQFFAWAFTYVVGQSVRDTLCGTKVLHRSLYRRIAENRAHFGDFDPFGDFDLLFGAARLYARIVNIPIRYRERVYGETNISRFRHGLLLFRMLGVAAAKLKFR